MVAAPLRLAPSVRSDTGRRSNNEDNAFASPRLAAVADGVGGHAAGEEASRAAIDALITLDKCRLQEPLPESLERAVRDGNERIGFLAECRPQFAGMATTLSAVALADDGTYAIANIGDSRIYLLRDGALTQLTRDDSLLQQLIELGQVKPEDAPRHPQRNIVLEVLDGDPKRSPEVRTLRAQAGDRLLLCSDGVSDVLRPEAIAEVLRDAPLDDCSQQLVDRALAAGSRDNVTAVVVDVVPAAGAESGWGDYAA
jgi:protein phosphatase